jgi:hypothetical protein
MLWFDFNNHDSEDVERNMATFAEHVLPLLDTKVATDEE